ncbi:biotin--[acetyl-CoA-carboxylase] ligase [Thermodesulforhabdus norvegica]|uniref:Bifunctional ligase/repressor BirA n=1 Tax=Thermodesulforhabdus norvegica TaxID=39841 RepID=A0A1I4RAW4_9BACT|nr:biotin--[acetyl-CoA-carboxylase] ligase [Thermodesulforhabdus norvegica]SFM49359.1 BirA family transcriptional regulator, biotin operon repressor / biotin-[acetyl-CoA-carboxylase] ligase [Thermodesulforhabdus norvegica]
MLTEDRVTIDEKTARLSKILKIFGKAGQKPVSGGYLASRFGVSRTMISKYIGEIESLGYRFEKRTGTGYRLIHEPDTLHPVAILSLLATENMGRSYHYCYEVGSTNDLAVSLALDGAPEGTCVVAEAQTKGRGRLGRSWLSVPGKGIYMSVILRPDIPPRQVPQLTLLTGIVLAATLNVMYDIDARVKWPNDVVIKGKKVAGILAESQIEPQRARFVVIGIGINVHHGQEDFSGGTFRYPPTSVTLEAPKDRKITRQHIVSNFLNNFEKAYKNYLSEGWEIWSEKLKAMSMLLGCQVVIDTGEEKIAGFACDFSPEGSLVIQLPDGEKRKVLAGDVVHVYPDERTLFTP